jgi:hypothetical protein
MSREEKRRIDVRSMMGQIVSEESKFEQSYAWSELDGAHPFHFVRNKLSAHFHRPLSSFTLCYTSKPLKGNTSSSDQDDAVMSEFLCAMSLKEFNERIDANKLIRDSVLELVFRIRLSI